MRTFQIETFRRNNGNATVYTRVADGNNTYRAGTQTMTGMQFMCNGDFVIQSVVRNARPNGSEWQRNIRTFNLGERIANPSGGRISRFEPIDTDTCRVHTDNGNSVLLENLRVVGDQPAPVEPVAAAAPATAARRRTATANGADFFSTLQARIIAAYPREIRLERTLRNRKTQTLENFIKRLLEEYNAEKNTIYVDTKQVQTDTGRRRSIGDIFMICRYYYPDCTLRQVYEILMNRLPQEYQAGFRSSYCTTINKYVWYYSAGSPKETHSRGTRAEWGHTYDEIKANL